jgi:Fe-S cluster assembly scaffold protein SufB
VATTSSLPNFKYGPGLGSNTKNLNLDLELQTLRDTKQEVAKVSNTKIETKESFEDIVDFSKDAVLASHELVAHKINLLVPKNQDQKETLERSDKLHTSEGLEDSKSSQKGLDTGTVSKTIVLEINSSQSHVASTITVVAEENSSSTIFVESKCKNPILQSTVIQVIAKPNSTLNITTKNLNSAKINLIYTKTQIQKGASITITDDLTITNNKNKDSFTSLRVDQNNISQNATAKTFTSFIQNQTQQFDLKTNIHHLANNTSGKMLARGVLQDNSKVSFQGKIHVPKNTIDTTSHQNFKVLTLGDKTSCDAVPVLDIHNDDVSVSHGVALGRIDEEQLFYLQSKGISKEKAIQIISQGFLNQALINMPKSNQNQQGDDLQ